MVAVSSGCQLDFSISNFIVQKLSSHVRHKWEQANSDGGAVAERTLSNEDIYQRLKAAEANRMVSILEEAIITMYSTRPSGYPVPRPAQPIAASCDSLLIPSIGCSVSRREIAKSRGPRSCQPKHSVRSEPNGLCKRARLEIWKPGNTLHDSPVGNAKLNA